MSIAICCYCSLIADCRPFGPGGSQVCFACATDPAHPDREQSVGQAFLAQFRAAVAMSPEHAVLIDGGNGPEPLHLEDFEDGPR